MSDLAISSYDEDTYSTAAFSQDSLFGKLCYCIPLLGMIPSQIFAVSIQTEISKTTDTKRLIELIELKNQNNLYSSIRCVLSAVVSAFLIMPIIALFFLISAAINYSNITKNNRIITDLVNTGYRPGFDIH